MLLRPRSVAEEHLYMDLHPCPCGQREWRTLHHSLEDRLGDLTAVFAGDCPQCKQPRRFEFLLPHTPEYPDGAFGGPAPSTIIDPGQYLRASDDFARVPASASVVPPGERAAAAQRLEQAIACLDEVLKFLPADSDELPKDRLFTADGKQAFLAEPGRFRRLRLEARRGAYERLLAQYRG